MFPRLPKAVKLSVFVLGALLVVLLLSATVILVSEPGRLWAAQAALDKVNQSEQINIKVQGLESPGLGHWKVQSIQINNHAQPWITVNYLDVVWQPFALLKKALLIDELHAQNVSVYKLLPNNQSENQQETQTENKEKNTSRHLDILVGRLNVEVLELLGFTTPGDSDSNDLRYKISAEAHLLKHSPLYVQLYVQSLDLASTVLDIELKSEDWLQAELQGSLKESAGGRIGSLLYLPENQPIDTSFTVNLTSEKDGYSASIESFSFPLSQRQVSAQGLLSLNSETDEIFVHELLLGVDETKHRIDGKLSRQDIDLNINLNQIPLDVVKPWHPSLAPLTDGSLTTALTVVGSLKQPQAAGSLSANLRYNDVPISVDFNGRVSRDKLDMDTLDAILDESIITAMGAIDFVSGTEELAIKITELELENLRRLQIPLPEDISGKLTSDLRISGTASQPDAEGQLAANIQYKGLPVNLEASGKATQQLLDIEDLVATIDQSTIRAAGKLDLVADTSALALSIDNLDVKALDIFNINRPTNLNMMVVRADAKLTGALRAPNGELSFLAYGDYQGQDFLADGNLRKDLNSLFIQSANIESGGGNILVNGDLKTDTKAVNLKIDAKSMPLDMLTLAGISLPDSLSATMSSQVTINGAYPLPQILGDAKLEGTYLDIPFVLEADGHYLDQSAELNNLKLWAFSEEVLNANGYYQSGEFDLGVNAEQLPTELLSAVGWYIQPGNFNTKFHAMGTLANPQLQGVLAYEAMLKGYDEHGDQQDIRFRWDLDVRTTDSAIDFSSMFTRNGSPPGELKLSIATQPYMEFFSSEQMADFPSRLNALPVHASLQGSFDLQTVSFLFDTDLHRLNGGFESDMVFSGTLNKPVMNGRFQARDANYENVITGTVVRNIQCAINAKQVTLSVDGCSANDRDEGQYGLSGNMRLPVDGTDGVVDLALAVEGANVLRRADIQSEATGEIMLSGDFDSLLASGKLNLSPLTASLDANYSSGIPTIRVEEIDHSPTTDMEVVAERSLLPNINFDLVLGADKQAYLRGRGLEAELQGQVAISGNLKRPLYEGDAETVRGFFEIFNKKFSLEQGNVNFANNAIGIAITGIYEEDGQRVQANLTGPSDDLKLTLSAVPDIPEDEILAFIIFGKPIQEVTPFEAIQLASAVQSLRGSGGDSFDPIGSIRNSLGVDALSVESAEDDNGETGVNVGVGKYLNEHVYLEVERTPSESQPWKGNIEIELTPNLNLESSTGGKTGIEGADLIWKRDY